MRFNFEGTIAAIALGLICIISLLNVIVRYATDYSFAFTEEFSVALLVITALFGATSASKERQHIRIAAVEKRLKPLGKKIIYIFQFIVSAIVLGLITYFGAMHCYEEYSWQSLSPGLGLPYWIYLIWLPVGSFLILIRLTQDYYHKFKELR